MEFIMLVGFPGAGKSTLAKEYQAKGYIIYSPDVIRNELNMHQDEQIQEVLNIMHTRMIEAMKNGNNIVYDSTNLYRKRRIKVLKLIKSFNYNTTCIIVNTPLSICKERNALRTGFAKVPDFGYDIMTKVYTKPTYREGWDYIKEINNV